MQTNSWTRSGQTEVSKQATALSKQFCHEINDLSVHAGGVKLSLSGSYTYVTRSKSTLHNFAQITFKRNKALAGAIPSFTLTVICVNQRSTEFDCVTHAQGKKTKQRKVFRIVSGNSSPSRHSSRFFWVSVLQSLLL